MRAPDKWILALTVAAGWLTAACGSRPETGDLSLDFALESSATSRPVNQLLFSQQGGDRLRFRMTSATINAGLALDEYHDLTHTVPLRVTRIGTHKLNVGIVGSDGIVILEKTLSWEYGTDIPPEPVVGFENPGTNVQQVFLLVSGNRGASTQEIWVSGDLDPAVDTPEGGWRELPANGRVPLTLSAGDGLKTLEVRYRNRFGRESDPVSVTVNLKTTVPPLCRVELKGTVVREPQAEIAVTGTVADPVHVAIFGDTDRPAAFEKVTDRRVFAVDLLKTDGVNRLSVSVRDEAVNYCPRQDFEVSVDPDHLPGAVRINDDALWTDDENVTLKIQFDHFASDAPEMHISGNVEEDDNTFQWIPYSTAQNVRLPVFTGTRNVLVRFRDRHGPHDYTYYSSIFLRPEVRVFADGAGRRLALSKILGLTGIDIEGCVETYSGIAFTQSVSCTPAAPTVTVTYHLPDGTALVRTAPL